MAKKFGARRGRAKKGGKARSRQRVAKQDRLRKRRKKSKATLNPDPRVQAAILEMNRGASLTKAAKLQHVSPKRLQATLLQHRLGKRKGRRWVATDKRRRKVPVITSGRQRTIVVLGYEPARFLGAHHAAVGTFVRTNDISVLEPFERKSVRAANGRKYPLETDPNELHRFASLENLPFHEIYEITSTT